MSEKIRVLLDEETVEKIKRMLVTEAKRMAVY